MSAAVALLERASSAEAVSDVNLRVVLEGLEIRPFTTESVEIYKEQIAKEANRFLWFHHVVEVIRVLVPLCLFCTGAFLLSIGGGLDLMLLFLSVLIFMGLGSINLKRRGSWVIAPFKGYAKSVPSFASFHAIEIKANLPDAKLFVHQFVQNRRVLDPFLSVQGNGEEYFIDVWDEPKFDAEQII